MLNIKHLAILGLVSVVTSSDILSFDKKEVAATSTEIPKLTLAIDNSKSDIDAFPPISGMPTIVSPTKTASTTAIKEVASPVMASLFTTSVPLQAK